MEITVPTPDAVAGLVEAVIKEVKKEFPILAPFVIARILKIEVKVGG